MDGADLPLHRLAHTLQSSNLPFYTAVWNTAKASRGVVALSKRIYWDGDDGYAGKRRDKKRSGLVDIVAENGLEWVKVSAISENRLLLEMEKRGWRIQGDDSYGGMHDDMDVEDEERSVDEIMDEDDDEHSSFDIEATGPIRLLRLAQGLQRAASSVRVRYQHPHIRFVLPNIRLRSCQEIDDLLTALHSTGAVVECADHIQWPPAPPLEQAIPGMLGDEFAHFTPILNIDCTILLAIVSDLSHGPVPIQPSYHLAIRQQIRREETERLLPAVLWPAMADRELLCTKEAARRMQEIVDLMGTPGENARTAALMGLGSCSGLEREDLIAEFQKYSVHEVPRSWKIPIKMVDGNVETQALPSVAAEVAEGLSALNRSVFLFGWASGYTTVSSNKTVAKSIEAIVEMAGQVGPDVWLSPTARSLLGKEKEKQ